MKESSLNTEDLPIQHCIGDVHLQAVISGQKQHLSLPASSPLLLVLNQNSWNLCSWFLPVTLNPQGFEQESSDFTINFFPLLFHSLQSAKHFTLQSEVKAKILKLQAAAWSLLELLTWRLSGQGYSSVLEEGCPKLRVSSEHHIPAANGVNNLHAKQQGNSTSPFPKLSAVLLSGCHFPSALPGAGEGFLYKRRACTAGATCCEQLAIQQGADNLLGLPAD